MTPATVFVRTPTTWLAYLLTGYFLYLQASLGPLMPLLREELSIGYTVASLHFSAFALGVLIMGVVGDRVSFALGRRRVVWGGGSGMAAGALSLAAGSHPVATLSGTFAMGLFGSLLLMSLQAALSDLHGDGRSVAISEANVVASVFAVLAPLAVGAFERSGALGWRWALLVGVAALVALFWRFRRVPVPDARPRAEKAYGRESKTLPLLFWGYCAVLFLAGAVEWSVAFWGAAFLEKVGFRPAYAAALMSAFFVAAVVGRLVGSRVARRVAGAKILQGALFVAVAGFLLFWLVPLLAPGPMGAAASVTGLFITGLGVANLYPFRVATATGVVSGRPDLAVARIALSVGTAILIAPFALGSAADVVGIGRAYGIVAALLLAAVATAAVVNHKAAARKRLPT